LLKMVSCMILMIVQDVEHDVFMGIGQSLTRRLVELLLSFL
jgi:hypothetical protein